MKDGHIVEFDEPHNLLQKQDGLFYKLVSQTGKMEASHLTDIARQAADLRKGSGGFDLRSNPIGGTMGTRMTQTCQLCR